MKCVLLDLEYGLEIYELGEVEQDFYGEVFIVVKYGELNIIDFYDTKIEFGTSKLQSAKNFCEAYRQEIDDKLKKDIEIHRIGIRRNVYSLLENQGKI